MSIITLTTDLGTKDSYLATVKGSIYSQLEDVKIVDISNHIQPFNIYEAAYILRNCYRDFPKGTIHIVSVNEELEIDTEYIGVLSYGHYFFGTDIHSSSNPLISSSSNFFLVFSGSQYKTSCGRFHVDSPVFLLK